MVSALVNEGKFDMVHVQNSTLAGGVAVGSVCNMFISPGGAVAIGIVSGALSVIGYKFITVSPKLSVWEMEVDVTACTGDMLEA